MCSLFRVLAERYPLILRQATPDTAPQFDTATPPNVEEIVSVLGAFSTPA